MKKCFSKMLQKTVIVMLVICMVNIPIVSNAAFKFSISPKRDSLKIFNSKYAEVTDYTKALTELNQYLGSMSTTKDVSTTKIEILDKVQEMQGKYNTNTALSKIFNQISNKTISSDENSSSKLLSSILEIVKSALGSSGSAVKSLKPNVVVSDMTATTADKLSGDKYNVKLSGNIYYADADSDGNPTSGKWVVLVHGFMMNGQAMADSLGQMYLNQGFNVLAPDLRGFGNSEGDGTMGYLESLDVWDWLTYINEKYPDKCDEIIVHGVSLGGATTVFLSGLEVDGQTISDKNVIGLVEDCGYTSMTGIINDMLESKGDNKLVAKILGIFHKTSLSEVISEATIKKLIMEKVDVGLTEENFEELQNNLNSLKKSSTPLLIVHGTSDSTVPFKNSDAIYQTAMENENIPYVQRFTAEGEEHAFIILGHKENVYEGHIKNFITQTEKIKNSVDVGKTSDYQEETEKETSTISSLIKALRLLKNMFGI